MRLGLCFSFISTR